MTLHMFLSILSLVLSLAGNILINCRKKEGFLVWVAANSLWIIVNLLGETNWPQITMFVVYIVLALQGYIQWTRRPS